LKVLLTGANGFVGSHILDVLLAGGIPTTVLLRPASDRRFLNHHLPSLEVRTGSIIEPESLTPALVGITHVIHCAGCTKAVRASGFYQINHIGTRNLVEAINAQPAVQRFVHISSLAISGPATPAKPASESNPPHPLSTYGESKLAAETEVRAHSHVPATIIRPPAVYGPRDHGFLPLFKAVNRHLLPRPSSRQALSLVFARDLARAVVACLTNPAAVSRTYFVASSEIVTVRAMGEAIASQLGRWTLPCPLPSWVLWPVCLAQEIIARVTGKPHLLNLQKYAELRAPGWVCDPSLLKAELGFECSTPLKQGIAETLNWYKEQEWL
jgi:nucleoside-diphosphate-sugar epimerase